jgi:ubiquinone/menaquinone biosynthesis C-methylase UbiE
MSSLNTDVRQYWEREPCGTDRAVVGDRPSHTQEWFDEVERFRYQAEPFIHAVAQFTRHRGKRILEVGVGAGTDHAQWARAGCDCYGVDLTDAAIDTTRTRLALENLHSRLQRLDAETLPFADGFFDVVYSWGVIHHSEHPQRIIGEIARVLKPGGTFIGMLYGRHSVTALHFWIRHALKAGKPWRSFADVIWHHCESVGTKAYTMAEIERLFASFAQVDTIPLITINDTAGFPRWISQYFPARWGWFIAIRATK